VRTLLSQLLLVDGRVESPVRRGRVELDLDARDGSFTASDTPAVSHRQA